MSPSRNMTAPSPGPARGGRCRHQPAALSTRLTHAQDAEKAAQAAWQVAGNRYRGGLATNLDVLTAEDALISARRSVAALQTRAFALDVALTRALGGGYHS
jgi:outer membrane protein TolC